MIRKKKHGLKHRHMSAFSSSLLYSYFFFLLQTGYDLKLKQNKEQKGRCNQNYGMEDKRIIYKPAQSSA